MMTLSQTRMIDQEHQRVGDWMQAQGAGPYREGSTCIGLERDGQLIAGTMYDYCNGASVFASIAITGPITREWLWFIFYYPFVQLGVRVLLGLISHDNVASLRFVRRLGFTEVEELDEAHPTGSLFLYRLHVSQCRFLKRSHHAKT